MLRRLYVPTLVLQGDRLTRKSGLFHRKAVRLPEVERIVAVVRDAMTHEEVMVGFFDGESHVVWISEFDQNFGDVMKSLSAMLPGMLSFENLAGEKPFEKTQKTLWERSKVDA